MIGRPYIPPSQIAEATRDSGAAWTDEKAYRPDPFKALGESWTKPRASRGFIRGNASLLAHAPILIALAIAAYFAAEILRGVM